LKATAFIGLGANLGDPQGQVRRALVALGQLPEMRVVAASSLYRSAPIGVGPQPDFVNAVARIETTLGPWVLLEALLVEEARFGRERPSPGAARTLDLDVLLYEDRVIAEAGLTVPHPRMHERAFVLAPLVEIAPDIEIPGRGAARALLAKVRDQTIAKIGAA
jgi:2-amino-4-hydroxy-6-hydroxymethyldihydropteridine diphosphokinase